jgi:outer membrane protein OmpA-like peptidoglycan-associated protein
MGEFSGRAVAPTHVTLSYSVQRPAAAGGPPVESRTTRTVDRRDMGTAHSYRAVFGEDDPERFPGTTALGVSTAVLEALRAGKPVDMRFVHSTSVLAPLTQLLGSLFGGALPSGAADAEAPPGTIRRVGTMTLSVLVNDLPTPLTAIHARGRFLDEDTEFWFLDDPDNPLSLKWTAGDETLEVIRIAYPAVAPATTTGAAGDGGARLERVLADTGRAVVYGIYFDTASDRLRQESEPVLREIADVLARNPGWTLSVEGHTDGIGAADANLDLSRRRSAAVARALDQRFGVAATRLTTTGYGESRPQDTNDTLAGRARNRRVELIRK